MPNLTLAELDFDLIKSNLKDFLKEYTDKSGAPIFSDFNFEGSNWAILLDVLAYNTHMNAYLANMVLNEMFLDSAVKRSSTVSLAKHLGYYPLSVRSARASITFNVNAPTNSPNFLTLERYTPFTTLVDGTTYTFVNLDPITIQPDNGVYTFTNVEVVEGLPLEYVFRVNIPGPSEKYVIPNDDADTSTLRVNVQKSFSDTTLTTYNQALTIASIDGDSKVFFIEENSLEKQEMYFGDGIFGKKLESGNLIRVQYLLSSGEASNVNESISQTFDCGVTIGGGTVENIITVTNSHGGADKEDINSIKFNASRFVTTNDRAVTADDYKALIQAYYPLAESVATWGGEDNDPPEYGTIFVSLKPYAGYTISDNIKNEIKNNLIENKKIVTIRSKFVEPEYFYVNLSINVKFDSKTINVSQTELKNSVITTVQNYFSTDLQKFDKDFVFSKLSKNIDNINTSIIGNLMSVKLQKRITPVLNTNVSFTNSNVIKFNNKIIPGSLHTTRFIVFSNGASVPARIYDLPNSNPPDYEGKGKLILKNPDTGTVINDNYGIIDYSTGDLTITALNVYAYPENTNDIRMTIDLQDTSLDIQVNKNQILVLDDSSLNALGNRLDGLTVNTIATVV